MKHARKLASLLLALVMVFALATTVFAQDVTVTGWHRLHYHFQRRKGRNLHHLQTV